MSERQRNHRGKAIQNGAWPNTEDPASVTICGVPYRMIVVDGGTGVVFSEHSGFYGMSSRVVFSYTSMLWRLDEMTRHGVPACHIKKMVELIEERLHGDHREACESNLKGGLD